MPRKSPFKHHHYPQDIILCVVRGYQRYPLSYQDLVDLTAERNITVDRFTVDRRDFLSAIALTAFVIYWL